jgi:DNA-binding response OmpR family regulator
VIFLTARRTLDDKLRGLTIGADDYLTKPFPGLYPATRAALLPPTEVLSS